mmetsp:Transcript_43223/g.41572  ORF Transcript_43223/g.41572 Transcript_43223/m.41572 type:complete len:175 (-) Transcript_43223:1601-2125(-)
MFHAQMFGFVAKCFKQQLKDPLDKPPSLIKTVRRILNSLTSFFSENSPLVWRGCALSIIEILENCFPFRLIHGNESVSTLLIEPLLKFHEQGLDTVKQMGASFCLKFLIEYFIYKGYGDMIDQIHQPVIQTTTKFKVVNADSLQLITKLIEYLSVRVASNYIDSLINLSLKSLN